MLEYSKIKRNIIAKGTDTMLSYTKEKAAFISSIIEKINTC